MIGPSELSARAGISKGYASDLLAEKGRPSQKLAIRIFRETGLKLGPVSALNDDEIAVLEKMHA